MMMDASTISLLEPVRRRSASKVITYGRKYELKEEELDSMESDQELTGMPTAAVAAVGAGKRRKVMMPKEVKKEEEPEYEEEYEETADEADDYLPYEQLGAAAVQKIRSSNPRMIANPRMSRNAPKVVPKKARGSPKAPGARTERSLIALTKKFMELREHSEDLNLNEAATVLGIQKRRLYDITNVLEGIDVVVKTGKNSIRWCSEEGSEDSEEKTRLEAELAQMDEEEKRLDDLILDLANAVCLAKEDAQDKPYAYVHFADVRSMPNHGNNNLGGSEQLTIAVKAGSNDASVEVADSEETGKFEMAIRCEDGLHAMVVPDGEEDYSEDGEVKPIDVPEAAFIDNDDHLGAVDDHLGKEHDYGRRGRAINLDGGLCLPFRSILLFGGRRV